MWIAFLESETTSNLSQWFGNWWKLSFGFNFNDLSSTKHKFNIFTGCCDYFCQYTGSETENKF